MPIGVLIPAYEPDSILNDLVQQLCDGASESLHFDAIIIVNDGSESELSNKVFLALKSISAVHLLKHEVNKGKGAALKTGLAFADKLGLDFVVTADADGQHRPDDIRLVAQAATENDCFVIGTRRFSQGVPLRSRIGNIVTATLTKYVFGLEVEDTQSGLRAFPKRLHPLLTAQGGDRYEYEFEALVAVGRKEPIMQVPIATIYEPGNPSSHFRPIWDSTMIYLVFLRYVSFVALISAADVIGFFAMSRIIDTPLAFALVRCVTVFCYFFALREKVFHAKGHVLLQGAKFIMLVVLNLFMLLVTVDLLATKLPLTETQIYLGCSMCLFIVNFLVQRYVIFVR